VQVPTGRIEQRVAKAEVVELSRVDELPAKKEAAITENVSPRGARVITDSLCAPGKLVRLVAPGGHRKLSARVIYCEHLREGKFAVGLRLSVRVEEWQKPR